MNNKYFENPTDMLELGCIPLKEALSVNNNFIDPISITTPEETFLFNGIHQDDKDAKIANDLYQYLDKQEALKLYTNKFAHEGISNDGGDLTYYILPSGIKVAKGGWYVYSWYMSKKDIKTILKLIKDEEENS